VNLNPDSIIEYPVYSPFDTTAYTGGPQALPHHLPGFHHYSGLYGDMYGASHQQGPVSAPPPAPASAPGGPGSRSFFTDLPGSATASHHPAGLPRIDNSVLTYLNDVTTASTTNGLFTPICCTAQT